MVEPGVRPFRGGLHRGAHGRLGCGSIGLSLMLTLRACPSHYPRPPRLFSSCFHCEQLGVLRFRPVALVLGFAQCVSLLSAVATELFVFCNNAARRPSCLARVPQWVTRCRLCCLGLDTLLSLCTMRLGRRVFLSCVHGLRCGARARY